MVSLQIPSQAKHCAVTAELGGHSLLVLVDQPASPTVYMKGKIYSASKQRAELPA